MPYFIVIPAYFLGLLSAAVVYFFMKSKHPTSPIPGYILFGTLGSVLGFVICNGLLLGLFLFVAHASEQQGSDGFAIPLALLMFVGPFVASGIGIVAGVLAGCFVRYRTSR